jgi:hypothetical protein
MTNTLEPPRNIFASCIYTNACPYYTQSLPLSGFPFGGGLLGGTDTPYIKQETPKKELIQDKYKKMIYEGLSILDKPLKAIDIESPICTFDWLSALVRTPEVQSEIDLINSEKDKEKKGLLNSNFRDKYHFSPEYLQNPEMFYKYNKYYIFSDAIVVFSNFDKNSPYCLKKYRDGKHIILAVDVTKKRGGIIKEFEKLLDRIERDYKVPKDTTRDKGFVGDIWKIYDYKTKDKLTFVEIARRLSGIKDNPTYNEKLEMHRQRVKRAYSKAKDIINRVKKQNIE